MKILHILPAFCLLFTFTLTEAQYSTSTLVAPGQRVIMPLPQAYTFLGVSAYTNEPGTGTLTYRLQERGQSSELGLRLQENEDHTMRYVYADEVVYRIFDSVEFMNNLDVPAVFRYYAATTGSPSQTPVVSSLSCDCPLPGYCGRECWCPGGCPEDATPTPTVPTHLIIHHSAGFNNSADYAAVVAYYWDFHVNTNGWDDIGYNWLIDPTGVIYEGRGSRVQGAHFSCMNSNTTGICLIGEYQSTEPTAASLAALRDLLLYELCLNKIDPRDTVVHPGSLLLLPSIAAHRDGNSSEIPASCASGTICPGNYLYGKIPDLRNETAAASCLGTAVPERENNYELVQLSNNRYSITARGSYGFRLLSVQGTELQSASGEGTMLVDLLSLPPGLYLLHITDGNSAAFHRLVRY